jgi:hypothetical protein
MSLFKVDRPAQRVTTVQRQPAKDQFTNTQPQVQTSAVRDRYYADGFESQPQTAPRAMGLFDSWLDKLKGLLGIGTTQPATPPATSSVDQDKVDMAMKMVNSPADLVNVLNGTGLNQAEKDALVAQLARDPNKQMCLFGDVEMLSDSDQAVIAKALGSSLKSGALTDKDLLALADYDQSGMGPSRLVQMLSLDPGSMQPGGIAEHLGQLLWARGGESDKAAAARIFTSSPELMARNLDTPEKRLQAFTSLTNYLDKADQNVPDPLRDRFKQDAVAGLARLFNANGPELMKALTLDGNPDGGVVLSKFFADAYYSKEGQPYTKDIDATLRATASDLEKSMNTDDQTARLLAARQLGRIVASVNGGAVLTIDRYKKDLAANKEKVDQLAGLIGGAIGALMPETAIPLDAVTDKISQAIAGALLRDPTRPDVALGAGYAIYQGELSKYQDSIHHGDLVGEFDGDYAAESDYIREQLELDY